MTILAVVDYAYLNPALCPQGSESWIHLVMELVVSRCWHLASSGSEHLLLVPVAHCCPTSVQVDQNLKEPEWIRRARESLERFDINCHGEGEALQLGAHQEEAKVTRNLSA